jgi:histidyl-tRNA synthetase
LNLKAPRGTFDILPEVTIKRQFVEDIAMTLFKQYGYQQIITPTFEHTELFRGAIGESTEIVQKEMYTFLDKASRSLTLRPEATAAIVRAYIEHNLFMQTKPQKFYYIGPMFRYERPQSGRYREFWQLGIEALGSADPAIDAENVLLLTHLLHSLGLTDLDLHLNSMGCPECRKSYIVLLKEHLRSHRAGLCANCQGRTETNPLRIFDCKNQDCHSQLKNAPLLSDFWCESCREHFAATQSYLNETKVKFTLDPALVRGFDYYTKTTFEVSSPHLGAQNALGGGGRYDGLAEVYGGPPTPAIGFALGIERIILALEKEKVHLPTKLPIQVFVAIIDEECKQRAFRLLYDLRKSGIAADIDYGQRGLKAQLKLANKLDVAYTVLLGPDELAQQICQIKEMGSGEQKEVKLEETTEYLKSQLIS